MSNPTSMDPFRQDRLAGTLLGAATNDASGSAAVHGALVASAIASCAAAPSGAASRFGRALVSWSLRHPWSADADTLQACASLAIGLRNPGVHTASSGAAMRAAIVGAAIPFDAEERRAIGTAIAGVTHSDPRAIDAALFVAEVAAACAVFPANGDRAVIVDRARSVVRAPELVVSLHYAQELVEKKLSMGLAARELGTGNAAIEACALAAFAFVRFGDSPRVAMEQLTAAAGKHARASRVILGAWMGTLLGAACLPWDKVAQLREGPFGPNRLHTVAAALDAACPLPTPIAADASDSISVRALPLPGKHPLPSPGEGARGRAPERGRASERGRAPDGAGSDRRRVAR